MDLMEIYCTIRWVSEISWRRHKLFIPRVSQRTWLGLYPTGISFVVDEPDGDTGSIQRGSAIWLMDRVDAGAVSQGGLLYGSMDRTGRDSTPRGSAIWSMDRTEKAHGYLLYEYGHWTWRTYEGMGHYTTWCLNNVRWNHWMFDWQYWTQNQLVWQEYYVYWGKGKAILPLIDLFTSKTVTTHLFTLGYD